MWKKGLKLFILLVLLLSLAVAWAMEDWSRTANGKLPSKTAVILHAVNNNLVTIDADIEPPDFLTTTSTDSKVKMLRSDLTIPFKGERKIPVRVYRYSNAKNAPVILYFHGGAFMEGYGNLETHDNILRALAAKTGAVVISPAYRVAPEHVFPSAVDDSYRTLQWAAENVKTFGGDPDKIAVAGDSAGGNLAAVTALRARDQGGPELFAQVLYYPLTTFKDKPFDSRSAFDSGYYLLSRQVMLEARSAYTPNEKMWDHPYSSPLEAESLLNLPPALVVTAEFDPLRDEGELYGKKLHEAGVPVKTVRYKGVMHGFVSFYEVMKSGDAALQETSMFLQSVEEKRTSRTDDFELLVKDAPEGWDRIKEEVEAFAIAVFLLGKSTINYIKA